MKQSTAGWVGAGLLSLTVVIFFYAVTLVTQAEREGWAIEWWWQAPLVSGFVLAGIWSLGLGVMLLDYATREDA